MNGITIKIAKRDGWDAPPYKTGTKGQQAERAVKSDFEHLRGWANNEWHWVGYTATIDGEDFDSLWGIDSPSMEQFEVEVFDGAIEQIDNEEKERAWAMDHEVVTV